MNKPASPPGDKRLWGARFRSPLDPALMQLSRADASYFRHAPYDIEASDAHARELERAGILTAGERETIVAELASNNLREDNSHDSTGDA